MAFMWLTPIGRNDIPLNDGVILSAYVWHGHHVVSRRSLSYALKLGYNGCPIALGLAVDLFYNYVNGDLV